MAVMRTRFARALRRIAATAKGSMSMPVASDAPARKATRAHSPEPDATSTTRRPRDRLRMLGEVARDGQPAAPGERPVGERGLGIVGLDLDRVPQRQDLVTEMETDPVDARDRPEPSVAEDEGAGR